MSNRSIAILVGALVVPALVAGCGGDDEDTTAETNGSNSAPALTKAEFIKQSDQICLTATNEYGKDIEDFIEENEIDENNEITEEQEEELLSEILLPRIKTEMEELRELGAPEGDEQRIDEIFTEVEEVVAEGEADPSTAAGNNDPFAEPDKKAVAYGFEVCGQS